MNNDDKISSNGNGDGDEVPPWQGPDVNALNLGIAVEHHSELRIAQRFVREQTGRLIYVHGVGWHWWDDTRWKPDTDGAAQRALVETIATAFRQAPDEPTQALRDQLVKDARKCESSSKFNGTLNMARNFKPVAVDPMMINANPFLLNMQNGTYDLTTQQLLPHNPDDLITKITTSGLGEPGDGPFHEFMRQILPDAELHDYVQRLMGYSLLGVVREHVLPIFYGRQGRNGKSVFLNTVMSTLGDFADTVDNSLIIQQRFQQHRTFKAKLAGLRLAVTKESDGGARLNAAEVKELTGGDRLQANKMRQDEFSWKPSHTLLFYTNFKPLARGDDDALWERIRIVTFEQQFTDGDKNTNKQLEERLKLHFPEVLRWLVDGYAAYINDGELVTPDRVRHDTEELRNECDDLGGFLEDCTHAIDGALAPGRTTFEAWTNWCRGQNFPPGQEKSFKRRMTDRGFKHTSKRVHGIVTRGYENIELHIGGLSEAGGCQPL